MKKLLIAVMLFSTLFIFSKVASAAEISMIVNEVSLNDRARYTMSLKSNTLVFKNEPIYDKYDKITINIVYYDGKEDDIIYTDGMVNNAEDLKPVRTVSYDRGKGNGVTIDLSGLPDRTYFYQPCRTLDGRLTGSNGFVDEVRIVIKGGKARLVAFDNYAKNLVSLMGEKSDPKTLEGYKNKGILTSPHYADLVKQAKKIVSGITSDYEKVKAIHDFVANNVWYDWDAFSGRAPLKYSSALEVLKGKRTVCDGYANLTVALLQAAGFPAKRVVGTAPSSSHAWTAAYVDNRWVFIDSTWDSNNHYANGEFTEQTPCNSGNFDMSLIDYSDSHIIGSYGYIKNNDDIWDGSLTFYDILNDKVLKKVDNFTPNDFVTSTYGFNIKDLYFDNQCTEPFKLNTMSVNFYDNIIIVNQCKGKEPVSVFFNLVDNEGYSIYCDFEWCFEDGETIPETCRYVRLPANTKFNKYNKPADPKIKGYTFLGWYDSVTGKKWNFATDKVKVDTELRSRWKKISSNVIKYKVSFELNNGVSPKSVVVIKGSKLNEPEAPSPLIGYKFAGWYKDSKFTHKWDFTKDKVIANITLYAGWKKI